MTSNEVSPDWYDVVWDIFSTVAEWSDNDQTYVEAVVVLYAQAPSYSVLSQGLRIHRRYEELDRTARLAVWQALRPYLTQEDDYAAAPLVYALWEDFFHDPMEDEVWAGIIGDRWPLEERLLTRLLPRSGPASPAYKYALYGRLLDDEPGRWDSLIYAGLLDTFHYGYALRIDAPSAEEILDRLQLSDPDAVRLYHQRLEAESRRRTP